tara:strand:+ start:304 stop:615 length:312 start_codon:yes stop_codon:yes gene_type:complete
MTTLSYREAANDSRYRVRDMDLGGFTFSETILHAGQSTRGHAHPWPEVYLGMDGFGIIYLDGDDHGIAPGALFVIPGGVHHRVTTESGIAFACFFSGVRANDK